MLLSNDRPVNCTNFTRARFCLLETNRKRSYTVIESTVQFDFAKNHPSTTRLAQRGAPPSRAPFRSWSPLQEERSNRCNNFEIAANLIPRLIGRVASKRGWGTEANSLATLCLRWYAGVCAALYASSRPRELWPRSIPRLIGSKIYATSIPDIF